MRWGEKAGQRWAMRPRGHSLAREVGGELAGELTGLAGGGTGGVRERVGSIFMGTRRGRPSREGSTGTMLSILIKGLQTELPKHRDGDTHRASSST